MRVLAKTTAGSHRPSHVTDNGIKIRSADTVKMRKEKMEIRNTQWRKQAKKIGQNASILAGGDGSRKVRNGETIAPYGWGVYGIGEHSVEY